MDAGPAEQLLSEEDGPWSALPADVLQVIGSLFTDPQHLRHAGLVCKQWRDHLVPGVEELHLDVPVDTAAWQRRVQRLGALLPRLGRCKAHVSSAVPMLAFAESLQVLGEEVKNIEHLHLDLSEGFELWLSSGAELAALRRLRSLTLTGGTFSGAAAQVLLRGLAAACPQLEELRMLPAPRCGLGDADVPLLLALPRLKVLAFQAYRLTAAGLMQLMGLQQLQSLSVAGLDAWGADSAAFSVRPTLRELHLGCNYELPPDAMERLANVPDLSMTFRWTDKLRGLLKTCSVHLSRQLVKLDLGCVRLGSSTAALEGLDQLKGLKDLRLSVYSNSDTPVTLDLSRLAPLSRLQVLHLAKQRAYFPEQRRLLESSISVPVTAGAVSALARSCPGLRALRLTLGRNDLRQDGLEQLTAFDSLRLLSISAEPFSSPPCPLPLDLSRLPRGLQQLELRNVDMMLPGRGAGGGGGAAAGAGGALESPRAAGRWPLDHLGSLTQLQLEGCRLGNGQLHVLVAAVTALRQLKLAHVAGLCNADVAALSRLTALHQLHVEAPHNKAVDQSSLDALAGLRELRHLTWETDDLSGVGPALSAFAHFTLLRSLALSCSRRQVAAVCGFDALQQLMPYCDIDLVQG